MAGLSPARPMTPDPGEIHEGNFGEAAAAFLARTAGKALFVSDGPSYAAVAPFALAPRAVCAALDGDDALPLFLFPDEIGCVVASGGAEVLRIARFFAEVRNVPCLVAPVSAMQDGVYEPAASLRIGGEQRTVFLKNAQTVCDERLMRPSLGRATFRLQLSRLALFEDRALAAFGEKEETPLYERAFAALSSPSSVAARNAALRRLEGEGLPRGEGAALLSLLSSDNPERDAYRALYALYAAFFARGKPRRTCTPDYAARAARAGVPYRSLSLPTAERYAARAVALERMRGLRSEELARIKRDAAEGFRYLTSPLDVPRAREALSRLPELGGGLTAVIRDFGLLEEV